MILIIRLYPVIKIVVYNFFMKLKYLNFIMNMKINKMIFFLSILFYSINIKIFECL